MDLLVSNYLVSSGFCLAISVLVAFRAGLSINRGWYLSLNLEKKIDSIARSTLEEEIVSKQKILFQVYRDTTESVTLTLEEVNKISYHQWFTHKMEKIESYT